jgi:dethiobiotin synthetase
VTRGIFVTGTDTGVGKTLASCALIHALKRRGVAAMPMKPVAAGASMHDGALANDDTVALLRAASRDMALIADVNPVLLREPMAPHIAAAREQRRITLDPILASFERLASAADFLVVEGVGGFAVPLDEGLDTVDLARALALPVVLVVGLRLGCLNHALLTARAIDAAGLPLAGWIANCIDPDMPVRDENVAALRSRLGAPLLGRLPYASPPDALDLARNLDVTPLIETQR